MEGLRGHTSGYAVPTFVIDAPGGGGKIPVMPNYLISYSDHKVVLRNYEGYITTYEEPETYQKHDQPPAATASTSGRSPASRASSGLLEGERMWIEPKGFAEVHTRGNTEAHRLQDPAKWVPFGVGAIEGTSSPRSPSSRPASRRQRREGGLRPRRGAAPARGRADRVSPRGAALARLLWRLGLPGCVCPRALAVEPGPAGEAADQNGVDRAGTGKATPWPVR